MRVRTRRFADLLERDGEALVLLPDGAGLVRLSTVGVAIVDAAVNGVAVDQLAATLERRFGAPPEGTAAELTERMVAELSAQGVLEILLPPSGMSGRHWRIRDDAAFVLSDPERVVVLNLDDPTAGPRALLGTAASIWRGLVGEGDDLRPWIAEDALLATLASAYAAEVGAIQHDVRTLLLALEAAALVQSFDPPEAIAET